MKGKMQWAMAGWPEGNTAMLVNQPPWQRLQLCPPARSGSRACTVETGPGETRSMVGLLVAKRLGVEQDAGSVV